MKVAVIGAGPSGLACAHELERHGIYPVVFEKRHRPGELFDHTAAVLQLFTRPYDPLVHLRDKFGIDLHPTGVIKSIAMKSPYKKATAYGKLGYFLQRGHDPVTVESQLYSKIKSTLVTNTMADYLDLSRQYDYVVVATGSYDASRAEGVWSLVFPTNLIGGTVTGKFDMTRMLMWVDTRYSGTAYAYLVPLEEKRAFLGLVVPESTVEKAREKWELFWKLENLGYDLMNEVVLEHNAGFVYPHQVGNILFVGIAGGFLEPFLGFGLISAIKSGVLAGRAIATGRNYEDLLTQLKEDMMHSLVLRDIFNKAKNDQLDFLMKVLSVPGLKHIIYNTNIDFVRMGTAAAGHLKALLNSFKNI
ncbi:MAG: NAD(P)/FAD-dependent oxidoreductase [Bacillota bacterium]